MDTTTELKTLDGTVIMMNEKEPLTLGKALGNILVMSETMNKLKAYSLGQKLFNEKEVGLDEADLQAVKSELEVTKAYNALITGQILSILSK